MSDICKLSSLKNSFLRQRKKHWSVRGLFYNENPSHLIANAPKADDLWRKNRFALYLLIQTEFI